MIGFTWVTFSSAAVGRIWWDLCILPSRNELSQRYLETQGFVFWKAVISTSWLKSNTVVDQVVSCAPCVFSQNSRSVGPKILQKTDAIWSHYSMKSLPIFVVPDFPPKLDCMLPPVLSQVIFSAKPLSLWPILQIFLLCLDRTSAFWKTEKNQAICTFAVLFILSCEKNSSC